MMHLERLWGAVRVRVFLVGISAVTVFSFYHAVSAMVMPSRVANRVAEHVSTMLACGRGVVAAHQDLINDPAKGDKGFTSTYVREKMQAEFERKTGLKLEDMEPETREALRELMDAAGEVVQEQQDNINRPGIGFKGFIPAVFGRLAGMKFRYATGVSVRQVTYEPRNAYNRADAFERDMLKRYETGRFKPHLGYGWWTDDHTYRYVYPLYIEEACLQCHGQPAGALDIAGKPKEGYKQGDLRGAISVLIRTD